jgi:membrane protein implicated in regulation of membrane protease activity
MMSIFSGEPPFWAWWILGFALSAIEMAAPGFFFLWLGAAAIVTGLIVLLAADMGFEWQLLVFAILAVASVVAWRMVFRRHATVTDESTLNRRGEQYVGRLVTLVEPIVNGFGVARVDDTIWRVTGPDFPAGRQVQIGGVRGTLLEVTAPASVSALG